MRSHRPLSCLVNMDGRIVALQKAKISVLDHGFLYGDSVYETFRTISGYPFQCGAHLDRLFRSASGIELKSPFSKKRWTAEVLRTVMAYWKRYTRDDLYIRIIISRGFGDIGFDPSLCPRATTLIIVKKFVPLSSSVYRRGVDLALVPTIRNNPKSIDPNIKSGNYLNNILAYLEAKKVKAFDAVMQNYRGEITEGTNSNVFMVKDGVLMTPAIESGLLRGLTRTLVIDTAKQHGISVLETTLGKQALLSADECFVSSSLKGILPVRSCDAKKIGSGKPGPLTVELMKKFNQSVKRALKEEYCIDIS